QDLAEPLEQPHGPNPVGGGGRQDRQSPDQSQGVDQQVPLAASYLFASVVALGAPGFGRLDRLAVDDRRTRRWLLAGGDSDRVPESGVDVFPGAVVPPGVEVVGDG